MVLVAMAVPCHANTYPFAMNGDFHKTTNTVEAGADPTSSFIFCRQAGGTVTLPDPDDSTCGTITKGRYGDYHRVLRVVAVGGECTITTESGNAIIAAPGMSAASLTTTDVCGFPSTGQSISLVSDGTGYHIWAMSCGGTPPAPPAFPPSVPPSPPSSPSPPSLPPSVVVGGVDILARFEAIEQTSRLRALKCRGTTSGVAGKCMGRDNGNWVMLNCNWAHNEIQLEWYGNMIMGAATSTEQERCMLRQFTDDNVVSAQCQGLSDNQRFYFDGERIKNQESGPSKCLQCGVHNSDANTNVFMQTCDATGASSPFQAWYWAQPGSE